MTDQVTESGDTVTSETVGAETETSEQVSLSQVKELASENKKRREQNVKLRKELDDIKSKLTMVEEAKLAEEGKWKEAYEKTKKELDTTSASAKKMRQDYALKVVSSQIAAEAAKLGCSKTSMLIKLASVDGLLEQVEVDENYNVTEESLKQVLDQAKKEYSVLFDQKAPKVSDVNPGKTDTSKSGDDLSKLSIQQKSKQLAELMA